MEVLNSENISIEDLSKHIIKMPNNYDLPVGMVEAPFVWNYFGKEIELKFVSGFVGFEETADGYLKPQIGWAVTERKEEKGTLPEIPSS